MVPPTPSMHPPSVPLVALLEIHCTAIPRDSGTFVPTPTTPRMTTKSMPSSSPCDWFVNGYMTQTELESTLKCTAKTGRKRVDSSGQIKESGR